MLRGHALGASGAAAGVQDQRDIVWRRRRDAHRCRSIYHSDFALAIGGHNIHLDFHVLGSPASFFSALGRDEKQFGVRVFKIEDELFILVGRVQRGGGSGNG